MSTRPDTLFPYTTLFRSCRPGCCHCCADFGIRRIPPQREAAVYLKHLAGHEALVRGDPHGRIGDVITCAHPAKRIFLGESVENRLIARGLGRHRSRRKAGRDGIGANAAMAELVGDARSEEHTYELPSLMSISYTAF